MDIVATLPPQDRSDLFRATADRMDLAPVIIEKDFWVCWTLKHLFQLPAAMDDLIFKGGTTLSKVYKVIQRFSEDVDISISRSRLGLVGDRDPGNAKLSNKRRQRLLDEAGHACQKHVQTALRDELLSDFAAVIGRPATSWDVTVDEGDPDQQTLLFRYPTAEEPLGYIQPHVRLECGCRSDAWPVEDAIVTPYCADYVPQAFGQPQCPVKVLAAVRTFWEKATILHQEYHRPADKPLPPRYSRHYYDLAMLAKSKYTPIAAADVALLKRVVKHKKSFFRCNWAHYDTAVPGTLRLAPPGHRIAALRSDYAAMASIFFGECPSFEQVLATLMKLEGDINRTPT